jgi:hypothetical protein
MSLAIGLISNSVGLSILYLLSGFLGIEKYALISLGFQYFVYLIHGVRYNSEKYYDASGSLTHLMLILFSLLEHNYRNPR